MRALRETFAALSEENQVEKESILDWEEMRRSGPGARRPGCAAA